MSGGPGVGVRLFVAGAEMVRQSFSAIGDAGKRMWAEIAAGEKTANPALKGLSSASREAQGALAGLAVNAGGLGRVLISIGPAGFAAAVGIGAAVMAFGRAADRIRELDEIATQARGLDVGVDMVVRYGRALDDAGGKQADFVRGLETFQMRYGAFTSGLSGEGGGFGAALERLGISRAALQAAGDMEAQLLLIADALARIEDVAARRALADKLGLTELLPLLEQGADRVRELGERHRELAEHTAEAAAAAGPMAQRIKEADKRIEDASDRLFDRFIPLVREAKEVFADFLFFLDRNLPGGGGAAAATETLTGRLADLRAELLAVRTQADLARDGGDGRMNVGNLDDVARRLEGEIAALERQIEAKARIKATAEHTLTLLSGAADPNRGRGTLAGIADGDISADVAGAPEAYRARTAAADAAARAAEQAARQLDAALERSRGPMAAYLSELDDLARTAGMLPGRQADIAEATLAAGRGYLDAAAKAGGLANALKDLEARDPGAVEAYAARLADLAAQRDAYPGGSAAFTAALEAETAAFLAAAQGAERAARARQAFDALWGELQTPQERSAQQRAQAIDVVNAALAEGAITADRAADALRRIEERYDALGEAQFRAAEKGEGWLTLTRALTSDVGSLDDALVSLIQRLIELAAMDFFGGPNKGDLWGSLLGAAGDMFGFGSGGGGAGGGGMQAGFLAGFGHSGFGPGERPTFERSLPAAVWAGAPRHHNGFLAPNERPAIITDDESVLTPGQLGALYDLGKGHGRAEGDAAAQRLVIVLRDESGGRLQAEEREGPDGPELDVLVLEGVEGGFNSGRFDRAMRNRFGLTPRAT